MRGRQCADLTVPSATTTPDGETITVKALVRVPASRKSSRIGSLVVNPGGPGASGVDYAQGADFIVGKSVRQRFDIVGFDPRGVGGPPRSTASPTTELDAFLGGDPTPDDAAEEQASHDGEGLRRGVPANARPAARPCVHRRRRPRHGHPAAALGDAKLNYLGKSYGTYLGATYADLFPELVGSSSSTGSSPPT